MELVRPLAKYEIIATDAAAFLEMARNKYPGQTDFTIRFFYGFYLPTGFNIWEGKPARSQLGVTFTDVLTLPAEGTEELTLGSDYLFVNGADSYVPLSIEIRTAGGEPIGRAISLDVPYRRGYLTTVRGRFLTDLSASAGIGIDPEFGGDINIDLNTF